MGVAPQYRSQQNTGPGGIAAIYAAAVPVPDAGTYTVLSLTRTAGPARRPRRNRGGAGPHRSRMSGQRPPAIATDTAATVHGDTALLTTRLPPEQWRRCRFNQVLGKRPVALLFSTPQLCVSRVCGPVTDVAVRSSTDSATG